MDLHPRRRSHSTHLPPRSIVFGFVQYRNTLVLTEFLAAIDILRISDGLGIGTALTACVAYFIFPYGLSLDLSMTFGAILLATDPVAVAVLLNELGAPPRLKVEFCLYFVTKCQSF